MFTMDINILTESERIHLIKLCSNKRDTEENIWKLEGKNDLLKYSLWLFFPIDTEFAV